MLHWANRISGFIVAAAVLAGLWLLFFEWNQFLIWQMVVLLTAQLTCLVVALGVCRVLGVAVLRHKSIPRRLGKTSQVWVPTQVRESCKLHWITSTALPNGLCATCRGRPHGEHLQDPLRGSPSLFRNAGSRHRIVCCFNVVPVDNGGDE